MDAPSKSKLSQYAATLLEMRDAGKSLQDCLAWLKQEGVCCALSTLSEFLKSQRKERSRKQTLADIAAGSKQCKEIDAAFAQNPAPQLESLIRLFKTIILNLTTEGSEDPEMLKLANTLTITACEFISAQTKAAFKERELALEERKYAETKKDDQTKALELCLEDAKAWPEVQELFKTAFTALRKVRATVK